MEKIREASECGKRTILVDRRMMSMNLEKELKRNGYNVRNESELVSYKREGCVCDHCGSDGVHYSWINTGKKEISW